MKAKIQLERVSKTSEETSIRMKGSSNMNTKHRFSPVFIGIALAVCGAIGAASAGAQSYSLTDLGVLSGRKTSVPAAINARGLVTGTSGTGLSQAVFCYDKSKKGMEDVSAIPNSMSRGFGINDSGKMVGDSNFGITKSTCRAAMFFKGTAVDLGTLIEGGPYSRANGINALGQVVGYSGPKPDSNKSRAFAWSESSGMFDLGTLGGTYAQAWAINDAGFVTGNSEIAGTQDGIIHAFIYQPFALPRGGPPTMDMLDLGTLGGRYSYGTFISVHNHVVGYSSINMSDDRLHAFLYDKGKMIDLGSLGGATMQSDYSYALGINARDQVVGYSYLPFAEGIHTPLQVAFIYSGGIMVNLNDRIAGTDARRYRLDAATAINDKGQIVAIAYDNSTNLMRAVLLTPIDR